MKLVDLLPLYDKSAELKALKQNLEKDGRKEHLLMKNLNGSSRSLVLAALFRQSDRSFVLVHDDADQAAYLYHDLAHIFGKEQVLMLPASFRRSLKYGQDDAGNNVLRTVVLSALQKKDKKIIVAYPESFLERVLPKDELQKQILSLHKGEKTDTAFIFSLLSEFGFQEVDYVYEPGQFARRGSLIDVYSWSNELPYRIDFFGDEIESIRSFEVETQLSKDFFDSIQIIPESRQESGKMEPVWKHFAEDSLIGFFDYSYCVHRIDQLSQEAKAENENSQLTNAAEFEKGMKPFQLIEFGQQGHFNKQSVIDFHCAAQDAFGKNFDLAAGRLEEYQNKGYQLYILSNNPKQISRIRSIFHERSTSLEFQAIDETLHEGFIDHQLKILCYTDHQLFNRFHKYSLRSDRARQGKMALTLKELMEFQFGDYVVHMDHGVGRFGGLFKTTINGKQQEVLKIMYRDNDVVLESIHNLHRVSKYRGKEGEEPTIHKLSSGAWERIKERSKKKIKDIARDLIKLYATRMKENGFSFSPDSYLQEALEASFMYEDTPDQSKATAEIKKDMESAKPMDRLVCGDVGFGKTELAVRAAFKAVADGKQVAVLVPTTVLALQHYHTFSERLADLPCSVDYLSRTRSSADTKKLLASLKEGRPDILVGTHKLIGKDVKFKDLGLLIIDEEQKFGVSVKEKLRQLKTQVDTLTLTATPIPRTLQFSLMGARDLSILSTPPANRYPIQTEIHCLDKEIIREGIRFEMERNGQIFFVSNRISELSDLQSLIKDVVPEARTVIAHGQMPGEVMEKIIIDFINFEYDVLISTSIVENGIDIPNANTIFINNAHKFGLSDLHQLRGRVGRSNKKAFCYLLAPPPQALTPDAKRRLQAIESFAELGSGLNIAMQDLDIRGAGNLLGAEQSGFIADLGFETYQRILKEAMHELKSSEFAELYKDEAQEMADSKQQYVSDCHLESDLALFFDESYIPGSSERMTLYREMDNLESETAIDTFGKKLIDRFGPMPQEAEDLLEFMRIRLIAKELGIEKLILKNQQMIAYFVANQQSSFYQSKAFDGVLRYATDHFRQCKLRESAGKRSMTIVNVENLRVAKNIFLQMKNLANEN